MKKTWYAAMIAKPATPCDTCTVASWGYCCHAEYGKCRYFEEATGKLKLIIGAIMLLLSGTLAAQTEEIGFHVVIDKPGEKDIEVHQLENFYAIDTLVILNFGLAFTNFSSEAMLADSRHFQIITNNIEFYCEKKRIVGRKKDGTLKFRNWRK